MDPGNWSTDLAGGSLYKYDLLFVILLSNFLAIFLQTLAVKMGVVMGKDLAQACRDHFSPRVNLLLWIMAEVAIAATDLAEVVGSAIAMEVGGCSVLIAESIIILCHYLFIIIDHYFSSSYHNYWHCTPTSKVCSIDSIPLLQESTRWRQMLSQIKLNNTLPIMIVKRSFIYIYSIYIYTDKFFENDENGKCCTPLSQTLFPFSQLLFGIPLAAGVCITALDVIIILFLFERNTRFRWLEIIVAILIFVIFMCFAIVLTLAKPNFSEVMHGMLVPSWDLLADSGQLYIAIGIVGATVMPHNLYLHSSVIQTRDFQDRKGEALRFSFMDTTFALCFALFINAAILIVSAAAFYDPTGKGSL